MENKWYSILFGAQLVDITDDCLIVKKDGKFHVIKFELDEGDCCGFARMEQKLYFEPNSERNPIITNVASYNVENEYSDGETAKITFYGEYKPLAEINCECGSGSGWQYGACITLVCKSLDIDDVICSW